MKKFFIMLCFLSLGLCTYAQVDEEQVENVEVTELTVSEDDEQYANSDMVAEEGSVTEGNETGTADADEPLTVKRVLNSVVEVLVAIALFALVLFFAGHMFYEIFMNRFNPVTAESLREERSKNPLGMELTPEEREEVATLCQKMETDCFTEYQYEDGNSVLLPTTHQQMKKLHNIIKRIIEIAPYDDEECISLLNDTIDMYNEANKREFVGSKALIWLVVIVSVLLAWLSSHWSMLITFGINLVLYYMSAMRAHFMMYRREMAGKSAGGKQWIAAMFAGLFGAVATAPTYRTVTKWSDGSTTTEDDNSQTWFTLGLTLVVAVFVTIFMFVVTLVNYLRNYVLYR